MKDQATQVASSRPAERESVDQSRALIRNQTAAARAVELLKGDGLMRQREVLAVFPVSRSTWNLMIAQGRAPRGVLLGVRCRAWKAESIRALIAASDQDAQP